MNTFQVVGIVVLALILAGSVVAKVLEAAEMGVDRSEPEDYPPEE